MRLTRLVVPLVAVALLGAACGGDGNGDGNGGGVAVTTDSITMVDNAFEPETFNAAADSSLTLTNEGQALHSFTVSDAGIDEDVEPGGSSTVDAPGTAGEYAVTCTYHPEMTATMTVE